MMPAESVVLESDRDWLLLSLVGEAVLSALQR